VKQTQSDKNNLLAENRELKNEILLLTEENRLLKQKLFGRKSEKREEDTSPGLFNEAEQTEAQAAAEPEKETITYERAKRKPGRKPLSDKLPRVDKIIDISEEEKVCPCCGEKLVQLPEKDNDIHEKLVYKRAELYVERDIYPKYVCPNHCGGAKDDSGASCGITEAKAEPSIIPKSIATPGLLGAIFDAKFEDGMPYYRQEKQFIRMGANISRQDMSNWQIKVGDALTPLDLLLVKALKAGPMQAADETRVEVMNEDGRANTSTSWVWLARGGPPGKPVVRYKYSISRGHENMEEYLSGYKGYLQTDGYKAYDCILAEHPDIKHVGCFAHARRRYVDAEKGTQAKSAAAGIKYIGELYAVERQLREKLENNELTENDFVAKRKELSQPVLAKFKKWINNHMKNIGDRPLEAQTLFEKAVSYTNSQWDKLIAYLDAACLTPDNNKSENAIRPFVIGRKNWLFFNCPQGAESSCILYSLIETAKLNNLNPQAYLEKVMQKAPTTTDWNTLLPWNIDSH
jgi:transposase